jgi:hypothetical protein
MTHDKEEKIRKAFATKESREVMASDSWKIFKIMSEFVNGFERMQEIGPCVSIFGSARTKPENKYYQLAEEAAKGSERKSKNLGQKATDKPVLNFSGNNSELWCEGGELGFLTNMIFESVHFKSQCKWFSAIVSKKTNLKQLYKQMKKVGVKNSTTLHLTNGNKTTQIICWQF